MGKSKGAHKLSQLTAVSCKNAAPGRHGDGGGLYLVVEPTGSRRWMQRIVIDGRRRDLGLGSYPAITLAAARALSAENRKQVGENVNPLEEKRQALAARKAAIAEVEAKAAVMTFRQAVDQCLVD